MSDNFNFAVERVLAHEGGYVNHPSDPGGETNFGISTRFLRSIGDNRDVKTLTRDDAKALYHEHFWKPFEEIEDPDIGTKLFDLAVNAGVRAAVRILQRALRATHSGKLTEDGLLGPKTLTAANLTDPELLEIALRSEAAGFYRALHQPAFEKGWLVRAYDEA